MATTYYKSGSGDARGLSPAIWADCHLLDRTEPGDGFLLFDDFISAGPLVTTTTVGPWYSYLDTGCTIQQIADEVGGVIAVAVDGDEEEAWMASGGNTGGMFMISDTAADAKKCWFEARMRMTTIVTATMSIGMAEEGSAKANLVTDTTGAATAFDFVGFRIQGGSTGNDPDGLDAIHMKASGAEVVVKNEAQVVVADTWYKVGWYYNGTDVTWFVDGSKVGDVVLPAATNFPDGEELAVIAGLKDHATSPPSNTLELDWICVGAET